MPGYYASPSTRLHFTHILSTLHMGNLQGVSLVTASDDKTTIEREANTLDSSYKGGQGAFAYPVSGVIERDQSVRTTNGEVASTRGKSEGDAGRCVCVEGVEVLH